MADIIEFNIKIRLTRIFAKIVRTIDRKDFLLYAGLVGIIILALTLRLTCFIGFAGGDPQDDGIYISIAAKILNEGLYDHSVQKEMVLSHEMVNPSHIFPSRILFNYVTALSMYLFGVHDYAAALFPLLCSLAGILLVYAIGAAFGSKKAGLLGALCLSLLPLDIIYATRITPDVPVCFFIIFSVFCFLRGLQQNSSLWLFAAGVAAGLGYLVKSTAITAILVIALLCAAVWIKERRLPKKVFLVFAGLIAIYMIECLYYKLTTDMFFLRTALISKVYKIKYAQEWTSFTDRIDFGWAVLKYPADTLFLHTRMLLTMHRHSPDLHYFGLYYLPVFIAFVWNLIRRAPSRRLVALWFLILYLFVEFGPLEITLNTRPWITYGLIEKQPRYLTVLSGPAALLLGFFLCDLSRRMRSRKILAALTVIVLAANALHCTRTSYNFIHSHTNELKKAAVFLTALPPKPAYVDWLGMHQLYYYSALKLTSLKNIDELAANPRGKRFSDSYAVLGGARGIGVVAEAFEQKYRHLLSETPKNWIPVKSFPGEQDVFRSRSLTVYYIP